MVNIFYIIILGSGLGLYLCKSLCELMGGKIAVKSMTIATKFTFYIREEIVEDSSFDAHMGHVTEGDIQLNFTNVILTIQFT